MTMRPIRASCSTGSGGSSSVRAPRATASSSARSPVSCSPTWPKAGRRRLLLTASRPAARLSGVSDGTAPAPGDDGSLTALPAGAILGDMTEGRFPPRDLLAALEARQELGSEYERALVEGFVEQVGRE